MPRAEPAALRERLLEVLEASLPEATALARWMAAKPELSLEEHATAERYVQRLQGLGFRVERGQAGLPTAFVARRGAAEAPLRAALLAEMDALPGIGHACGHNLSGPASLLAAEALAAVVPERELEVVVVGTPGEETGVGKRRLVEAGVFDGCDVAMMAHASDMRRAHRLFLGNRKFVLTYHGRAAHAAAYPERGVNALDAVVLLLVSIGLLRQQLASQARIHAIVSEGGQAPNVIPERAQAVVWVRALEESVLEEAAERVLSSAEAAATATGARLEPETLESSSPPMQPNLPLADVYRDQLELLGLPETDHAPDACIGSSDITHVARVLPTIHPNFPIGRDLQLHTRAFAEAAAGPGGEAGLAEGARALALTVLALVEEPVRRAAVARAGGREPR